MAHQITVTLCEQIATELNRIAEILDLSLDQCAEHLIERCLDLYKDTGGDTMCLIGLAEEFQYSSFDEARAVAERIAGMVPTTAVRNERPDRDDNARGFENWKPRRRAG